MSLLSFLQPFRGVQGASSWCRRALATHAPPSKRTPQTFTEKVVQKYAVDWPSDRAVRAGDYVMIQPEHVMTHDNTGPVISK